MTDDSGCETKPHDVDGQSLVDRLWDASREIVDKVWEHPIVSWHYLVQTVPHLFEVYPHKREIFNRLWKDFRQPTNFVRDAVRVQQFMELLDIANEAPEGDYLEIGTHRGLSAKIIYSLMDQSRTLFCLDTFEGFVASDLETERSISPDHEWQVGFLSDTSPEVVANYIGDGTHPNNLKIIKGWFPDSFTGLEDRVWRFIHLDMDLYEPTRAALEILWPRLLPGGVMVFHDYINSGFRGIKPAVDGYFGRMGLRVLPMGDRWYSAMIVKPRPIEPSA